MNDSHALTDDDLSAAILRQLEEMNTWLRVMAEPVLIERLRVQLRTKTERDIYQASTGGSTREVGAAAKVSNSTVAAAWDRWSRAAIVRATGTPGRYQRLVDLSTLAQEI